MNSVYSCLLVFSLFGCSNSAILSHKYRAIYGFGSASVEPDLSVTLSQSRIRCARTCDGLRECGGFNFRKLSLGLFKCEFKESTIYNQNVANESDVIYYEKAEDFWIDCSDHRKHTSVSGVQQLNLAPDVATDVYCDMETNGGGWTVLIKREDGSVDFERNWTEYRNGFGHAAGEYWLGLENMYNLTNNGRSYRLRVDIQMFTGESYYAEYDWFKVGPETDGYFLQVSGYTGTAGDSLYFHNNMSFSTFDVDNDPSEMDCAEVFHCGFWYNKCSFARPTGLYGENVTDNVINGTTMKQGIIWLKDLGFLHPKYIDMKIRP